MRNLKYLAAYIVPFLCLMGFLYNGFWSYSAIIFAFVLTPILDPLFKSSPRPHVSDTEKPSVVFDLMLYMNVVWVYGLTIVAINSWQSEMTTFNWIGQITSLGIVYGSNGINVAHELGHRKSKFEQFLAWLLLIPSFYIHFFTEHNYGHHLRVATKEDPATARKGENLYAFYWRCIWGSYRSAWQIQAKLLKQHSFISQHNLLLWHTLAQVGYFIVLWIWVPEIAPMLMISGTIGFLLLETINYIEHYGLLRIKTKTGRYERVREVHSWNANFPLGRILLYELTRHSDHHYKSTKPYYRLESKAEAPELPFGYPLAMLISFIPPLWFALMNQRLPQTKRAQ